MPSIRQSSDSPPGEEAYLLHRSASNEVPQLEVNRSDLFTIYSTFLGVFIASADEFLVLSTYTTIASQFHRLSEGSWLLVAYNFGYCIALPMASSFSQFNNCNRLLTFEQCGTLSDLYGRKNVLVTSYILFLLGCFASGASSSLVQLVLARVLAGASGAGMVTLVSIIIIDLVPSREVAVYRSYENVMTVIGRSLGVPIGGLVSDTVGWRWTFFGQVPFILFCALVGIYALPDFRGGAEGEPSDEDLPSASRLRDIDFAGIITFSATILLFLLLLRETGMKAEDQVLQICALSLGLLISSLTFITTELFWARKPIIPVPLLLKELGLYCLVHLLLNSGRTALVINIIPYFIRVEGISNFLSSVMYIQVAAGVSVGGIIAGVIIKRMGRYKTMAVLSLIVTILSFLLIFITWRDGCGSWESSILFLVGFAPGILFSALFIGMSQSSPEICISSCIGTFYLSQQLGVISGSACGSALIQSLFMRNLSSQLENNPHWKDIPNILNDVEFSRTLPQAEQIIISVRSGNYFSSIAHILAP
ncbi:hypothetical protein ETB97_003780 [Aspergillus alliaceus]|uniref:Major facilitator superfamily (MFS) profile domain-containing protein n=1 Tax=Petromyces alliaceus TaxID=209559 RepID=A0A8H6A3L8_PETAA|nr:hypothetical protein ETB97_003780 [Aspergillus burnettii]